MNRTFKMAAVLGMALLWLTGCRMKEKEPENVVTEQPVLGVDIAGYMGFGHLSAYTLEGETPSVLYLPADENAYVGGTCIISKKEGLEVTLNLNPMFSEEYVNKPLKEKLKHTLDGEYSITYRENYADLEISDITSEDAGAVKAETSYLVYDDNKKAYVGQWLEYYMVELEDGRFFEIVFRVDSDSETPQTGAVVEEMEKYLETDLAYEAGFLQAKIDGYSPNEDELARMNGNTVPLEDFYIYLPEGWDKNTFYSNLIPGAVVYGNSMDQKQLIFTIIQDEVGDSGQLGSLTKGEQQIFKDMFEEELKKQYGQVEIETNMMGMTEMGFVFTVYIKNYVETGTEVYIYYICRGNKMYGIGGVTLESSADESEMVSLVDGIYSSMEVR